GRVLLPRTSNGNESAGRLLVADDLFALADPIVRDNLSPLIAIVAEVIGAEAHVKLGSERLNSWVRQFDVIRAVEVHACLGQWIERERPRFGPGIKERFERTKYFTKDEAESARNDRRESKGYLNELLQSGAVLCLPTTPMLAPPLESSESVLTEYRSRTLRFTSIAGVGGLPQITLPLAVGEDFVIGISLIAGPDRDAMLLDLAVAIAERMRKETS
ncbi:MAG: amidase family protein, partial [Candidatus Acidiferrum sp.]